MIAQRSLLGKKIEIKYCYLHFKLDSSLGLKTPQEAFGNVKDTLFNNKVILNHVLILDLDHLLTRENDGTEREAQRVGLDMVCSRKLFLTQRKSRFLAEVCFPRRPPAVLPRSQVLNDTLSAIT